MLVLAVRFGGANNRLEATPCDPPEFGWRGADLGGKNELKDRVLS